MATKKKMAVKQSPSLVEALKSLPLARIASISAYINGTRTKRYKDKPTAIKSIGKLSKQRIVEGMLVTGGTGIDTIENLFGIRRAYARDIVSKLETVKGLKVSTNDKGIFVIES